MNLEEKYSLNLDNVSLVRSLPEKPDIYLYILPDDYDDEYSDDKLYSNENGKLNLISYKESTFYYLLLFLKKYRANPELLPKNLKHVNHDYLSSEIIYKLMQFMLTPMNNYEEFKSAVTKATKEIKPLILSDIWGYGSEEYYYRLSFAKYGMYFVFINSKDEMGINKINMNGDELSSLVGNMHRYIYHNKEENSYEVWAYLNDYDTRGHAHYFIDVIFYEEKYLYEYLLNYTLNAVVS